MFNSLLLKYFLREIAFGSWRMSKVLLIEDDSVLAAQLVEALQKEGWNVEHVDNGKDGLQLLQNFVFDLVLLDWNLPDLAGIDVCKFARNQNIGAPIIFLTGNDETAKIEAGLDTGADDYVTKPFQLRELMARMRSVLRRSSGQSQENLSIGDFRFDKKKKSLYFKEQVLLLTATESELLEYLMRHPDQPFSALELFRAVWESDSNSDETTVRVHIRVLRRKFGLAGFPELIRTVLGKGYFVESAEKKVSVELNSAD